MQDALLVTHAVARKQPRHATSSKAFRYWPLRSFNHNVGVSVIRSMLEGVAWSTWADTALSVFIYEITGGSNMLVGVVDGATGIVSMLVALPIGWIADTWQRRKARLITIGGVLTPFAVAATAAAVIFGAAEAPDDSSRGTRSSPAMGLYGLLLAAMCVWGVVESIANGPAQARGSYCLMRDIDCLILSRGKWHVSHIGVPLVSHMTLFRT